MKTPDVAAPRPAASGEPNVTLAHERAPRYRTLSIVIPCFNERATLATLVTRVLASPVALHKEIVIVDDGSTDGSADVVRALAETHRSPRASFVTLAQLGQEDRDELGGILEIRVHHDDGVPSSAVEARGDRHLVPEIA